MAKSPRYLIIHGHFYQPPRENPWSGTIINQPTAAPFPNWNARINRECYAPNSRARLIDGKGKISRLINNYEYLNFNIGPTLMSWLKDFDPQTLDLIIRADRKASAERSGHGPAIAQVYNHIIMPLANSRDKSTQISWGTAYFKHHFGRPPEGMWLAETAVDLESLKLMSQAGLKFTILSQNQIDRIRPLKTKKPDVWIECHGDVDPREPYRVFWGPGSNDYIDVFVYDGPISRAVAFENLLRDGQVFLNRLLEAFGLPKKDFPRLVNLATDGESYGHHFHFGDMALGWLFNELAKVPASPDDPLILTNYGEYLSLTKPRMEAKIIENSSWSCAHGVERWRSDCGCHTGGEAGWNQKWRTPLRNGLNWLRDQIINIFEVVGSKYLKDPWQARNDYIRVLLANYNTEVQDEFLVEHANNKLDPRERELVLELMEAQLMSLYMFTSCGWFFDDLAGLEPVQNLQYALRAIELSQKHTQENLTEGLLEYLRLAIPNDSLYKNGEDIWQKRVVPTSLSHDLAAAHWAAAKTSNDTSGIIDFNYQKFTDNQLINLGESDQVQLFTGQVTISDPRLRSSETRDCLVISTDGPAMEIAIRPSHPEPLPSSPQSMNPEDIKKTLMNIWPEAEHFSLETLWPEARQNILEKRVLHFYNDLKEYTKKSFNNFRTSLIMYRQTERAFDWMERFIYRVMAEADLEEFLKPMNDGQSLDLNRLNQLLSRRVSMGTFQLEPILKESAETYLKKLFNFLPDLSRPTLLAELSEFIQLLKINHLEIDFWDSQNQWYYISFNDSFLKHLSLDDKNHFQNIGKLLDFETA